MSVSGAREMVEVCRVVVCLDYRGPKAITITTVFLFVVFFSCIFFLVLSGRPVVNVYSTWGWGTKQIAALMMVPGILWTQRASCYLINLFLDCHPLEVCRLLNKLDWSFSLISLTSTTNCYRQRWLCHLHGHLKCSLGSVTCKCFTSIYPFYHCKLNTLIRR